MAGFDYARARSTADRLLARYGQAGKLLKYTRSGPEFNPTITWPPHDCTFVVTEYQAREIDGTRILATDRKVLLAAGGLAITPTTSDKLSIGGVDHSIIDIRPLSPGGTVVMHEMQVRR